jgi:translocation and assembly module TamB
MRTRSSGPAAITGLIIALLAAAGTAAWAAGAVSLRARDVAVAILSGALARPVGVGRITGDPWRGLVLEDVVVGGAEGQAPLLSARRIVLHFDPSALVGDLAAGRGAARSVSQVLAEEPFLHLERDPAGRWNFGELAPPEVREERPSAFLGRIVVVNGTLVFTDRQRKAPGPFATRLVDVSGAADFAHSPRVGFRISFVEERGNRRASGRMTGRYMTSTGALDVDLDVSGADLAAWGSYLLASPHVAITGGRIDAVLHVLRVPGRASQVTDIMGRLSLSDGRARFARGPVLLTGVSGEIHLADRWLRTTGLRGAANGSPLEARGEASFYGEPRLDLAVRSPSADLAALSRVLFPSLAPRVSGTARGEVRIVGTLGSPRLEGRIEAARGRLDGLQFSGASADIALHGGTLSLTRARVSTSVGRVAGGGFWRLGSPEFHVTLMLDGADAAAVSRWAPPGLPSVAGRISGLVTAAGHGSDVAMAGRASVSGARVRDVALDAVDTSFRYDASGLWLDHLRVRQGAAWAAAWGRVEPGGGLALGALARVDDLASMPDLRLRLPARGRLDFAGTIAGRLDAPEVTGAVQAGPGAIGALAYDSLAGGITVRPGGLELDEVRARSGRARYRASGRAGLGGAASLALVLEAEDAPAAALQEVLGLSPAVTGTLSGRANITGSLRSPRAVGEVALRQGEILGYGIDEASAAFRWDGTRLVLEAASVRRGQSTLRLAGTYDRRTGFAIDLSARGADVRDLPLPPAVGVTIGGTMDLSGRLTGTPSQPVLAMAADSGDLVVNGVGFDRASGTVRWESSTLRLDPLALRRGDERYEFAGALVVSGPPRISLAATVSEGRLGTLFGLSGLRTDLPLDGVVSGTAGMDGPLARPAARLDLRLTSGRFGEHTLAGGRLDLSLSDGSVTVREFDLRPQRGRIAALGRFDPRGDRQIEVSGADLDLDLARPLLRSRGPMAGRLNFTAQIGGTHTAPALGADLEITSGSAAGVAFDQLVASAFYRDGVLNILQASLSQGPNRLRVSGSVPVNPALLRIDDRAPLDLRLRLTDASLGLLRLVTDGVEEASGPVTGEVRVDGTLASPRLGGGLRVNDGLLRLRGLRTPIEALRADLRLEENVVRVASATARIGGGVARLEGAARLILSPAPSAMLVVGPDAPLVLGGDGLRVAAPPFVDARFDGTARAWGTLGDPRRPPTLDGHITISEGTVTVAEAGAPAGARASVPIVFQGVRLEAGRDLAVQVGGLRIDIAPGGSLLLTGTARAPRLDGTVEAQRGTILALGNPFDLREATVTFQPSLGLRPSVHAEAETHVGSTRITLVVSGIAPDALSLDLHSDPELSRQEMVAILARQAGITQLLSGDWQGALRAEISRRLFGQVSLALGRAIGLNDLAIEYDFAQPLRLRAGKLLLPGLYLAATATFADQTLWVWALEYRFARGWQFSLRVGADGQRDAIIWYTARF